MIEAGVKGRIVFEGEAPPLAGAEVHVFLEDTTYADVPARVVRHDTYPAGPLRGGALSFEMKGLEPDEHRTYTLRVLIDRDGDGRISRGDLISMASYAVLTHGSPSEVDVLVQAVE